MPLKNSTCCASPCVGAEAACTFTFIVPNIYSPSRLCHIPPDQRSSRFLSAKRDLGRDRRVLRPADERACRKIDAAGARKRLVLVTRTGPGLGRWRRRGRSRCPASPSASTSFRAARTRFVRHCALALPPVSGIAPGPIATLFRTRASRDSTHTRTPDPQRPSVMCQAFFINSRDACHTTSKRHSNNATLLESRLCLGKGAGETREKLRQLRA